MITDTNSGRERPTMSHDFDRVIDRRNTGSSKWNRYPADVLPMWVADMDFAVAPEIIDALHARLDHPVLGYAVARDALRAQIVASMAQSYGWTIAPQEIVFLPGVEPGFNMSLRALLAPGNGVVVQTPMYRPILSAPGHWNLTRLDVELRASQDGRHRVDMAALGQALDKARAFLFCNPHNPLGKVFARDELRAIAEACLARKIVMISDEIHCDLLFDGRSHVPMASLGTAIADNTITLMSASKTYNIAGLKAAFAIIRNDALREKFNAARAGMVDSVNVMGLEATLAAFAHAGAWKRDLIAYLQGNRDYLMKAVRTRLGGIHMHEPEATFLAWLDCSALALPMEPQRFFLERGKVGFSAGDEFGSAGKNFIRLNFGCPRAVLEDGIKRMEAALRTL